MRVRRIHTHAWVMCACGLVFHGGGRGRQGDKAVKEVERQADAHRDSCPVELERLEDIDA